MHHESRIGRLCIIRRGHRALRSGRHAFMLPPQSTSRPISSAFLPGTGTPRRSMSASSSCVPPSPAPPQPPPPPPQHGPGSCEPPQPSLPLGLSAKESPPPPPPALTKAVVAAAQIRLAARQALAAAAAAGVHDAATVAVAPAQVDSQAGAGAVNRILVPTATAEAAKATATKALADGNDDSFAARAAKIRLAKQVHAAGNDDVAHVSSVAAAAGSGPKPALRPLKPTATSETLASQAGTGAVNSLVKPTATAKAEKVKATATPPGVPPPSHLIAKNVANLEKRVSNLTQNFIVMQESVACLCGVLKAVLNEVGPVRLREVLRKHAESLPSAPPESASLAAAAAAASESAAHDVPNESSESSAAPSAAAPARMRKVSLRSYPY